MKWSQPPFPTLAELILNYQSQFLTAAMTAPPPSNIIPNPQNFILYPIKREQSPFNSQKINLSPFSRLTSSPSSIEYLVPSSIWPPDSLHNARHLLLNPDRSGVSHRSPGSPDETGLSSLLAAGSPLPWHFQAGPANHNSHCWRLPISHTYGSPCVLCDAPG